jgi:transcription elongation GreA/GreB family factor
MTIRVLNIEGHPRTGSISHVSLVARVLMAKAVGDVVVLGDLEIEVLAIAE